MMLFSIFISALIICVNVLNYDTVMTQEISEFDNSTEIFENVTLAENFTLTVTDIENATEATPSGPGCRILPSAVWELKQAFFDLYGIFHDPIRRKIKSTSGIEIDDEMEFKEMICILSSATSLTYIANVTQLSEDALRHDYKQFQDLLQKIGGVQGLLNKVFLQKNVMVFLELAKYPHFPLNITYKIAYDHVKAAVKNYGPDFMSLLDPWNEVPRIETEKEIVAAARLLYSASSGRDFLHRMKWHKYDIVHLMSDFTYIFTNKLLEKSYRYNEAMIQVLYQLAVTHFFELEY